MLKTNVRLPSTAITVNYQLDDEASTTSTITVELRWFGVNTGKEDAYQHIPYLNSALLKQKGG